MNKVQHKFFSSASAALSSYGISILSFITDIDNVVGVISALAGAFLTVMLGMLRYSESRIKHQEARRLELENKALEYRIRVAEYTQDHEKNSRTTDE